MTVRVAGPRMGAALVQADGTDPSSLTGLVDAPRAIADRAVDHAAVDAPVPISAWRPIASTFTGCWMESSADAPSAAAGTDPPAFRPAHLTPGARTRARARAHARAGTRRRHGRMARGPARRRPAPHPRGG